MIRFALPNKTLALIAASVTVIATLTWLGRRRRTVRGCRLPPGPAPLPLVGNLFGIDAKKPWVTYTEWAARYGQSHAWFGSAVVLTSERL